MKKVLKKMLPNKVKEIINTYIVNRPLYNVFGSNYKKRVLISYITMPFKKKSTEHSNFLEVTTAAKIFNELGFSVDVMHYDGQIPDLKRYDVIYGFGCVFQKYFESELNNKITIHYAAGMHVSHQNTFSLKRVKDVYSLKGKWLTKSARFVEKTWSHQTTLVDGIIALGNEECANTYKKFYDGKVYSLPAPYFSVSNPYEVINNSDKDANKSYLWFGSSGLIHKGLDLCLEYFKSHPELNLHICGNVYSEFQFVESYYDELFKLPNVFVHGFVKIDSEKFVNIVKSCTFVIFPSCSEGGSPSVITVVGNGGLIPIITKESSVNTGGEIWINGFRVEDVSEAISISQSLSNDDILELQLKNINYVEINHSHNDYYINLKEIIKELVG